MRHAAHAGPAAVLVGILALAAGCGPGPASVQAPQPDPSASRACANLHDRLPETLENQPRRETSPASELVAAWGSPPIVVRCGVDTPANLQPTSRLAVVNGVQWFPEPERSPMRFTAVHRSARVELLLPEEYGVPAEVMVQLAEPIKAAVPETG